MILLNDIKGQLSAVRYLRGNLRTARIAPGYLFSGPEGVGRALCAKAFAMALISKDTLNHPDVLWLGTRENQAIKIDEIRGIKDMLYLKPYEADYKICVIEPAHTMTQEAANALLKVLEEPPRNSLLILITHKKELLPKTVTSRLPEVRFYPLTFSDTRDIIRSQKTEASEKEIELAAYFSQGSPGKALQILEKALKQRKDELAKKVFCEEWDIETREDLTSDIEMLIMIYRDIAFGKVGLSDMVIDQDIFGQDIFDSFTAHSVDKIQSIVEGLIKREIDLAANVNPKLVAQTLPGVVRGEWRAK